MMNRRRISDLYGLLLAVAVCFALGACGDEEGDSTPQASANPDGFCTITPHSVEISPVDASATPLTRSATGEPEQKATYAENLGHNFSAEAALEAAPPEARTRAGSNLATGAQYRVVAYDDTGLVVGNVVYKQGSTEVVSGKTIKLKEGVYRLFAYTFNSASTIRELDADNRNVTVNSGEDFMTYVNVMYLVTTANYSGGKQFNINFVRQCVRLTVTVKAEGYANNNITAASLTLGNAFGSGSKWNGYTYINSSTLPSVAGTVFMTKATGNGVSVDCGSSSGYQITAPLNNQAVTVSGLSVTIGGAVKTIADFSFPYSVMFIGGESYRLTITLRPYYVLSSHDYVPIDGVKWARTNLQRSATTNSFADNPWDYGSYWNPYDAADVNRDPCRKLGSGWRAPTGTELATLANNRAPAGTRVLINGTINTIGNYGWAPTAKGLVVIRGNQALLLPPAGGYDYEGYPWEIGTSGSYISSAINGAGVETITFSSNVLKLMGQFTDGGFSLRCVHE